MIELRGVAKWYPVNKFGRYFVFRDLHLTLPSRRNIGILGRNGVGKSTLIRLIGGVDLPDRGQIRYTEGDDVAAPLGLSGGFSNALSAADNVRFVGRIRGDDEDQLQARIAFVREFAEIGEFFDRPMSAYSSGMRARVGFGLTLSFDNDYYLIDEATAVGDEKFRQKSARLFQYKKDRASIIMVSHSMAQLAQWCEAGVYIRPGGQAEYFDRIQDAIQAYQKDQQ
ncbi:MAG TPA: ABC transporter ATP-binding protein [Nevskiaceae bacterium]|nr:ABC transporter ATP-binding protein [Nevskiaceae bacterium]